jgi:protein-tyrosine phosphatase
MIDLHCHILPGVDDGALDLADAVAMGRQADADGIATVCATPHIRHDHDVRIAELAERRAELNAALEWAGVAVRVAGGGEVAETVVDRLTDDELRAVSLGGGGTWILLEPRPGPLSDALTGTVRALRDRGFRALVAHPERHFAPDLGERLVEAVADGALVQVTAAHVETGHWDAFARDGLVHVVASDAHSSHGGRPVVLSGALAALRSAGLPETRVRWIAETVPRAILAGEAPARTPA